jgi:hypothetical protein
MLVPSWYRRLRLHLLLSCLVLLLPHSSLQGAVAASTAAANENPEKPVSRQQQQQVAAIWGKSKTGMLVPTQRQIDTFLLYMRPWSHRLERMKELSMRGGCGVFEEPLSGTKALNYRILLAGESGLGKTTMMNNLFRSYIHTADDNVALDEHPKTKLEDFIDSKLRLQLQHAFSVSFPEPNCASTLVNYFLQAS